jgi:uncharacterized protein
MSERQGVEIDYCPECRGVWLDRGELDKIIAADKANSPASAVQAVDSWPTADIGGDRDDRGGDRRKRKKESFFGDLFDF